MHTGRARTTMAALGLVSALCASGAVGQEPGKPKNFQVKTPDGVTITAYEYGKPDGSEIVMIHGFMQSHLSWTKQVTSSLADEFRIITYDFRGHGASDKLMEPSLYNDGSRFADELKAVLDTANLQRPIVVGWSYGSRIIGDYLIKYGSDRFAGLNLVGSAVSGDAALFGPGLKFIPQSFSDDLATSIAGTRQFLRACFSKQPSQDEYETMLVFNAMVPARIRQWLRRPAPYEPALKGLNIPVLVTHGAEDQITLPSLARYVAETVPGAKLSMYEGVGHAPFWEDPDRFNRELSGFARDVRQKR